MALERTLLRVERFLELADHVTRVCALIEEVSLQVRCKRVREAQCPRVLRGGLAGRAQRGGARSRRRRELEHRFRVAGSLGVVREPGEVRIPVRRVLERRERLPVQLEAAVRRQRFLDREAGELVPERDAAGHGREHARGETFLDSVQSTVGERLEHPELGLWAADRHRVEQRARGGSQPCGAGKHGVPDRGRDLSRRSGKYFGHEEGIAGGGAIELVRVDTARFGELRDRRGRERAQPQAAGRFARRQLADHDAQPVPPVELVVAVAREHERGNGVDPAGEQLQDVEGRLVRTLQILEHEDRRRLPPQLASERRRNLMRLRSCLDEVLELSADGFGDVEEGPERTRSEQRVARAPEQPRAGGGVVTEASEESSLADAGLAPDEHETSTHPLPHVRERGGERRQLVLAFE